MKEKLILLVFLLSFHLLNAQEIKLNSSVASSAGNIHLIETVHISKWQLGEVHTLVLKDVATEITNTDRWNINSWPNPFAGILNLQFETQKEETFTILVSDLTGKKLLFNKNEIIWSDQLLQLDLSFLASGFYILTVVPSDHKTQKILKIQKL